MLAALVFCLLAVAGVQGQRQEFQEFLEQMKVDYKLLGLSAGSFVLDQEDWLLRGDLGQRMAEDATPIQGEDKFPLNDAGRPIVTTLAARLVERGVIDWHTTVMEVYPDLAITTGFLNSTLLDLLVHNGGAPPESGALDEEMAIDFIDDFWERSNYSLAFEGNPGMRREMAKFIFGFVEASPKGTYSEFGYSLAVGMLEERTKTTFRSLLLEEVFQPLDMQGCGVGPTTLDQSLPPVEPWSHFAGPWGVYNIPVTPDNRASVPSALSPDNGLHCSLTDLRNFMSAHLQMPEDFLSAASWSVLHTAQSKLNRYTDYAPGWLFDEDEEYGVILTHPGSDGKSYVNIGISLKYGAGWIMAGNTAIQGGMRQEVGWRKIDEYMMEYFSTIVPNKMKSVGNTYANLY